MNKELMELATSISKILRDSEEGETKIEIDSKGIRVSSYYPLIVEQSSEIYEFQKRSRGGVKDLKKMLSRGNNFTYDFLLKFKKELNVQQGGFVTYPENQGGKYSFDLQSMAKWIYENEKRIFEKHKLL